MTCTFDLDCYLVNVLLLFFQLSLPHTWIFAGPYGSTTSRTTLTCASYIATYSTDRDSLMTTSSTGTCWNLWVESFWPLIIMASPICWNQMADHTVVDQTYFGCNTYTVCHKHPSPTPYPKWKLVMDHLGFQICLGRFTVARTSWIPDLGVPRML